MAKLNQIIAVVNGKKSKTQKAITEIYHQLQKAPLFEGINRTYKPVDEEGETLPSERKNVQYHVKDALRQAEEALTELLNTTATQDWANCQATADVQVDGKVILGKVPVTHLLFLEKQLNDLHTFISKLPTLDTSENWRWSEDADCYATDTYITHRTQKLPKTLVKYEATEEHPAQTEVYYEDIKVGEWHTVKFSAAIPAQTRNAMAQRVEQLQEAVKFAREEANNQEVEQRKIAKDLFDFVFRNSE